MGGRIGTLWHRKFPQSMLCPDFGAGIFPRWTFEVETMVIRYNYAFLLGGLLFLLIGSAADAEFPQITADFFMDFAFIALFIVGVWSLVRSRTAFIAGWILAGLTLALSIAVHLTDVMMLRYLAWFAALVFLSLSCTIAVSDVLFGGHININRLIGAACIYLLSGTIWGIVFSLLQAFTPGAFEGLSTGDPSAQLRELIYFAFVTLTTLGYGDIAPVTPVARTVAYLVAILGQMYLTVLVAALVGLHIAGYHARHTAPAEVGSP